VSSRSQRSAWWRIGTALCSNSRRRRKSPQGTGVREHLGWWRQRERPDDAQPGGLQAAALSSLLSRAEVEGLNCAGRGEYDRRQGGRPKEVAVARFVSTAGLRTWPRPSLSGRSTRFDRNDARRLERLVALQSHRMLPVERHRRLGPDGLRRHRVPATQWMLVQHGQNITGTGVLTPRASPSKTCRRTSRRFRARSSVTS